MAITSDYWWLLVDIRLADVKNNLSTKNLYIIGTIWENQAPYKYIHSGNIEISSYPCSSMLYKINIHYRITQISIVYIHTL